VEKWITGHRNSRIYVSTELITFTSEKHTASLFQWDFMLLNFGKAWTVQHETSGKSFKKCGISNALGTEGDALFEGGESSELTTEMMLEMRISGNGMTSMNFILHHHFAKCFEFEFYI